MNNKYCIHENYIERLNNEQFDDTIYTDEHQNEVYAYARQLFVENNYTNHVVDFGCGSAYKLLKYFKEKYTIGIEVKPTYKYLINKYPNRMWCESPRLPNTNIHPVDMVICSDVIEHVVNPDGLLESIYALKPKTIVLSTPDRDMLFNHNGPPKNVAHVREWSYKEFRQYISQYFEVEDHFISNIAQCTQVIVCKPRLTT